VRFSPSGLPLMFLDWIAFVDSSIAHLIIRTNEFG
jgi:hypothetical protein